MNATTTTLDEKPETQLPASPQAGDVLMFAICTEEKRKQRCVIKRDGAMGWTAFWVSGPPSPTFSTAAENQRWLDRLRKRVGKP